MTSAWWTVVGVVIGAALTWFAILAMTRATRMDRLNIRVDLTGAALFAALERRAVVARAIAAADPDSPVSATLTEAADAAESATRGDREAAENRLSTVLAQTDPARRTAAMTAELADAQTRVAMARRFHNDAVRDARALGGRRMVRWLRLAGHAERPEYFEIAERVTGD